MKLLEALKNCTIYNLDCDRELLVIGENWEKFLHNLLVLTSEESVNELAEIELTDEVMKLLEEDNTNGIWLNSDPNYYNGATFAHRGINYYVLCTAWLTEENFDFEECVRIGTDCYLWEPRWSYSFSFTDPEFSYQYESDIDLT